MKPSSLCASACVSSTRSASVETLPRVRQIAARERLLRLLDTDRRRPELRMTDRACGSAARRALCCFSALPSA